MTTDEPKPQKKKIDVSFVMGADQISQIWDGRVPEMLLIVQQIRLIRLDAQTRFKDYR